MQRQPLTLIVNSRARHAGRPGWEAAVLAALGERFSVEVRRPASGPEAEKLAHEAVAAGAAAVVVAGGDGTVNSALQALAGSGVPLGVIPLGTGNDLARQLSLPAEPARAAERIAALRVRASDVLRVNGRRFCTVGGLGIVSRSALLVNRARAHPGLLRWSAAALGTLAYRLSAAAQVVQLGDRAMRVRVRGCAADDDSRVDYSVATYGMFVVNHRSLGGGITLPVESKADDGILELLTVHPVSRPRLLDALARLVSGRPIDPAVLSTRAFRALRLDCDSEDEFVGDGESLATGRAFDIVLEPLAIQLLH